MAELLAARRREGFGAKILDPCVGPATFPQALTRVDALIAEDHLTLVDVDDQMVDRTRAWCAGREWAARIVRADYLTWRPPEQFDLAILNPPYLRQEWLDADRTYRPLFRERLGVDVPGTANLYVYFLVKAVTDLLPGGSFSCIVPDTWRHTRFGEWLEAFLSDRCVDLAIEPVPDQPFDGVLIDAAILTGTTAEVGEPRAALPALGKSLFYGETGFAPLQELFETRRGLRLKQSSFFLCRRESAPEGATPFVKHVRHVPGYEVLPDHPEAALLVPSSAQDHRLMPELLLRLKAAQSVPDQNETILTWWKERPQAWFSHPPAPYAPILFNYYLRSRPRHIRNREFLFSDNFYGLTPRSVSIEACLALLNSTFVTDELLACSRPQGSGLAKLQLYEYRNCWIPDVRELDPDVVCQLADLGRRLAVSRDDASGELRSIDRVLRQALGN
ncbi:MAG TPA: hypothetical protein DGB72_02750 [Gemmatimonadetes bacterium]|nr:hypothetical protein [Gemmatimonadota bacterium]